MTPCYAYDSAATLAILKQTHQRRDTLEQLAWLPHGVITFPNCPYGTAYPDGCVGAPVGGSFQRTNFSTFAIQSGQTWATPHPQPWNLACIDYACGIPAASFPLQDPATASAGTGPGKLPTGCSYNSGTFTIVCQLVTANIVLDGFDLSLHGGVFVQANPSLIGNLTIQNTKFRYGSNFIGKFFMTNFSNTGNLTLIDDDVNGGGTSWTFADQQAVGIIQYNGTGSVTVKYTPFVAVPARALIDDSAGDVNWLYSYIEGLGYPTAVYTASITGCPGSCLLNVSAVANGALLINAQVEYLGSPTITIAALNSGSGGAGSTYTLNGSPVNVASMTMYQESNHADPQLINFSSGTMNNFNHSYSTILETSTATGPTALVTPYEYPGSGTVLLMTNFAVDHSTLIANKNLWGSAEGYNIGNGNPGSGTTSPFNITNQTWTSNYLDHTGTFGCFQSTGNQSGAPTYTGNVSLTTGNTVDGTHCN